MSKTAKELIKAMYANERASDTEASIIDRAIKAVIAEFLYDSIDKEDKQLYFCITDFCQLLTNKLELQLVVLFKERTFFINYRGMWIASFELPYIFSSAMEQKAFTKELLASFTDKGDCDIETVMKLIKYDGIVNFVEEFKM